jgi:hypothetical protein
MKRTYYKGKRRYARILVVASKEIRLEVNADKTNYIVMSRDQKAGRSHGSKNGYG